MTTREDLDREAASRIVKVLLGLLAICEDKTAPAEARIAQLTRVLRFGIEAEERKRNAGSAEPESTSAAPDHPHGSGREVQ